MGASSLPAGCEAAHPAAGVQLAVGGAALEWQSHFQPGLAQLGQEAGAPRGLEWISTADLKSAASHRWGGARGGQSLCPPGRTGAGEGPTSGPGDAVGRGKSFNLSVANFVAERVDAGAQRTASVQKPEDDRSLLFRAVKFCLAEMESNHRHMCTPVQPKRHTL